MHRILGKSLPGKDPVGTTIMVDDARPLRGTTGSAGVRSMVSTLPTKAEYAAFDGLAFVGPTEHDEGEWMATKAYTSDDRVIVATTSKVRRVTVWVFMLLYAALKNTPASPAESSVK